MDNAMRMPKVMLFDWDGTLADTYALLEGAHNHVHNELGLPIKEPGWYKSYFGMDRNEAYNTLYAENSTRIDDLFMGFVYANNKKLLSAMDNAEKALIELNDMGIICAIVTNKRIALALEEIKGFGWQKYFKTIVGGDEPENSKPSPEALEIALQRIGYDGDTSDVWMIGDTINDQLAAKNLGCPFILYEKSDHIVVDRSLYQPSLHFYDFLTFVKVVRDIKI